MSKPYYIIPPRLILTEAFTFGHPLLSASHILPDMSF